MPFLQREEQNSIRLELQRDAVDAIAQMGGRRSVFEDMAEMAVAPAAMHLGADHEMADVAACLHRPVDRIEKARPTGAALKFFS